MRVVVALLLVLLVGCVNYRQPPHTKETDTCLYDEVYFACLSMAQNQFKAINDGSEKWSTAEIKCSNMAYASSLRNSPNIGPRCR